MDGRERRLTAGAGFIMDWQPIANAPFDRDLELAVIDKEGPHAVMFACRRALDGWINANTKQRVSVHPTHWRDWEKRST
jgi:hypothetical protein